jgi:MauM/NapG family ferredoxin protein
MSAKTLRRFRRWVQLAAFLLFIGLLIWAGRTILLREDLFFLPDPLTGLANMVAAGRITLVLLAGTIAALVAALALGRVWCGWLCPLGTVLDWVTQLLFRGPSRRTKRFEADPRPWLRRIKYFLLFVILLAALLGNLTFLVLDPITLIYRASATAAWPALVALISLGETVLYRLPFLRGLINAFEAAFRGMVLPMKQPLYALNIMVALLFIGILALNAVRERFWCRYLCPLGALLGLVSKVAWLRRTVGDTCIDCQRCARACPTGTIDPTRHFESDPAECIMCLECAPTCPRAGQQFVGRSLRKISAYRAAPWQVYDPSRRMFLGGAATALVAVGLFASERAAGHDDSRLIRPPGARKPEFLSQCIRCGICLKVCPTSGLQPSLTQAGWAGLWSPVLVPRLGHCDYACNACGQACPVGAIPPLALEEKQQTVIGQAYINRDRCIPWSDNRICLVCEEMCPLPEKAIILKDTSVQAPDGSSTEIPLPYMVRERCTGCGICENRCPLNGEAAIRVYAPTDLGAYG